MFNRLIEAAKQPTIDALTNAVILDQQNLVTYSQNYLSEINKIMSQLDNDRILMQQKTQTQQAINELYSQITQIQDYEQLDLLHISKKSLNNLKKKSDFISINQKEMYEQAIQKSKKARQAIQNLNKASNMILQEYYNNNNRDLVDQYLQQGVILSERYQSLILKELSGDYSAETVFQIEGEVFMITDINIAAQKLIKSDISASSKGGKIKGRFNISKSLLSLDEQALREEYGLMRLNELVENNPAKAIMDLFLSSTIENPVSGNNQFGQYRISRGKKGKYIVDWIYNNEGYHGEIGNEGDLSEIYLAAIFNQTDLSSGNILENFIKATKVDNISGALVGDFRTKIEGKIFEFSAKSNKASYTLIGQMQTLAYQIIGLNAAGFTDIKNIIAAEYDKNSQSSSNGNGRNIVEKKVKEKVQQILKSLT